MRKAWILGVSFTLTGISGCGCFESNPTPQQVQHWFSELPPNSPGEAACGLLKRHKFSCDYEGATKIAGHREEWCLLFAEWVDVTVHLSDGRIESVDVFTNQNFP